MLNFRGVALPHGDVLHLWDSCQLCPKAPALPLALSWEGSSEGQVYGTSFVGDTQPFFFGLLCMLKDAKKMSRPVKNEKTTVYLA